MMLLKDGQIVMLDSAVVTFKLHLLVRLLSHQSGFVVCFLRFVKGLMIHAFSAGAREPMHFASARI